MKKAPKLVPNSAGGIDLLVERSAGNEFRVLTGYPEFSLRFWRSLRRLTKQAIAELESRHGG